MTASRIGARIGWSRIASILSVRVWADPYVFRSDFSPICAASRYRPAAMVFSGDFFVRSMNSCRSCSAYWHSILPPVPLPQSQCLRPSRCASGSFSINLTASHLPGKSLAKWLHSVSRAVSGSNADSNSVSVREIPVGNLPFFL